ncbi:hypothetical protein [Endozoicomonas sp. SESOKO1]|uniref:hypothetical protein n=1 Tax=Endozoicomonas sp. SESOKO1 TaxID=2828742 RepID=UPI002147B250|nr:hypothetical protein [Endozoicomonas sp. SESOKO1]
MQAIRPSYSHPESAQQAVSSAIPDLSGSIFNGKEISNHRSHGEAATAPDEGRSIEYAFWEKKPLEGRQITCPGQSPDPSETAGPYVTNNPVQPLNALALRTLDIIQEVNASYSKPHILVTGSYARFLQNRCPSFNNIDMICTTKDSANKLSVKLGVFNEALHADRSKSGTLKSVNSWSIPGCKEIKLPKGCNILPRDGSGMEAHQLLVNLDDRVSCEHAAPFAIRVPGVSRPVWCLPFAEETRLLGDTLEHLVDNLELLTVQLTQGKVFDIPQTMLFNSPQNNQERIYGLLMRCLLTLDKARQFISLISEWEPDNRLQEEQQRLHALAENMQSKLSRHICRSDFECRVSNWLTIVPHVTDYQMRRREFIESLLAMMHP